MFPLRYDFSCCVSVHFCSANAYGLIYEYYVVIKGHVFNDE